MQFSKHTLRLYAVTDGQQAAEFPIEKKVEEALLGGATLIQLREKALTGDRLLLHAKAVKAVCDRFGVPLIINDNVELALASGAAGVHLGQQDMPPAQARALLGPDKIIGVSARTVEQALRAQAEGADYLGCGAVFATSTKQDARALPHDTLRQICRAVTIPVVAIGGITRDNALALKGAGIAGIAVVSAVFGQPNIRDAAETLRRIADQIAEG